MKPPVQLVLLGMMGCLMTLTAEAQTGSAGSVITGRQAVVSSAPASKSPRPTPNDFQ